MMISYLLSIIQLGWQISSPMLHPWFTKSKIFYPHLYWNCYISHMFTAYCQTATQFGQVRIIICAARRAAQIWRSLCVRVCHYVKGITWRRIDECNTFCMQMPHIILLSTLSLQKFMILSINGNIRVIMVDSSISRLAHGNGVCLWYNSMEI